MIIFKEEGYFPISFQRALFFKRRFDAFPNHLPPEPPVKVETRREKAQQQFYESRIFGEEQLWHPIVAIEAMYWGIEEYKRKENDKIEEMEKDLLTVIE